MPNCPMALSSAADRFVRVLLYAIIAASILFLCFFLFVGSLAFLAGRYSREAVTQRAIAQKNPQLCSDVGRFNLCIGGLCSRPPSCFFDVALALKDPAVCDMISQDELKMECIVAFKGKPLVAADCLGVDDPDAQGRCVAGMEADISACDMLENNNAIWRCYQINIDRMDAPSPTLCDELYADKDVRTFDPKKMCYSVLAKKLLDPRVCEKLPTPTGVDNCERSLRIKMMSGQIANSEPFGYKFFQANGFQIRIPSVWKVVQVAADDTRYDLVDRQTGAHMAQVTCPILEVGYEAWDFTVEKSGGALVETELRHGTPHAGTGLDPLHMLFIRHVDGVFDHTCEVRFSSEADLRVMQIMKDGVRADQ